MNDLLSPVNPKNPVSHGIDQNPQGPPISINNFDDFEEGTVNIPIPSKGVFYNSPFRNMDDIYVRPLDWRDEDILTTKAFIDDGSVFDKLVTAVIQTKGISSKHLIPVDRDTILLWLRSTAMGNEMTIDYTCQACSKKNSITWDLSTLKLPEYSDEIHTELAERGELTITTPRMGLKIKIKVPTIGESNDTEKRLKRKKENEKSEIDFLGTGSVLMMISGIEMEEGKIMRAPNEIRNYFNKVRLPLADSRYIRTRAAEINLKYNTKQDSKCQHCGHVVEDVELPIVHPNFLWT